MSNHIDYLEWKVETDKEWINVEPKSGYGKDKITVTVTPSTIHGDSDTAGTITIICLDCDDKTNNAKKINVTRCTPECIATSTTRVYENVTQHISCDTTDVTINIPCTITTYFNDGCEVKTEHVYEIQHYTLSLNKSEYIFYYPNGIADGRAEIIITRDC